MQEIAKKELIINFNGSLDGQFRKDASNKKLLKLIGGFDFTLFHEGLKKTYECYDSNN